MSGRPRGVARLRKRIAYSRPSRRLHDELLDVIDTVVGRRDPFVPPRRLVYVGAGDYRRVGDEFRRYFTDLGGLEPTDDILDLGCGIGRMAVPLTGWLSGRYEGLDIVPKGIDWCTRVITPRFPNFHFQLADVHNTKYNPAGTHSAHEYRLPFGNDEFDFVIATSLFTHLLPAEAENYIAEIGRVIRPGGTVLATYFLLNPEARDLLAGGMGLYDFRFCLDNSKIISRETPEAAIAHDEDEVHTFYEQSGLLVDQVRYGSWCGREQFLSIQDIVVAKAVRRES